MIIDCISDLHGHLPSLEGGDLLIVAGDLTATDSYQEYILLDHWIRGQDYSKKIIIAGNHDNLLQNTDTIDDVLYDCDYLCDSGTEFEGLKIWGSPWTKRFAGMNPRCMAFTVETDEELAEKWNLIPEGIDILITHSPSFGNFDYTTRGESCGSLSLWMLTVCIRPKLHVFGHIHEAYGHCIHHNGIHLVNASHVNQCYDPVNKPIRIEL